MWAGSKALMASNNGKMRHAKAIPANIDASFVVVGRWMQACGRKRQRRQDPTQRSYTVWFVENQLLDEFQVHGCTTRFLGSFTKALTVRALSARCSHVSYVFSLFVCTYACSIDQICMHAFYVCGSIVSIYVCMYAYILFLYTCMLVVMCVCN